MNYNKEGGASWKNRLNKPTQFKIKIFGSYL